MIDPKDGSIRIAAPRMTITRDLTRDQFFQSALFSVSYPRSYIAPPSPSEFSFMRVTIGGEGFWGGIFFRGERLSSVDLCVILPESPSLWPAWSMERELARRDFHDALLERDFGVLGLDGGVQHPGCSRRHCFPWGSVSSIFDAITFESRIHILYAE